MVVLLVPSSASAAVLETSSVASAYGGVAHRRSRRFLHKFRADSARRDTVSALNLDLFELARRTPSFRASSTILEEDSKKDLQELKTTNFNLDPLKSSRLFLPKWKRSLGQYLGSSSSSLDAPPNAPVPPFTGGLISLLGLVLICGVILDKWIWRSSRKGQSTNAGNTQWEGSGPQLSSTGIAMFLRRDLRTKESVEWVNMVLGKLWKVYRLGLETWLVGLLQPLIDNLQKPAYVKRVQIKQFYLGDEPISVRSVQRRASRRSNDLQYHIGLRYTGGARMLLLLKLKAGFLPITIPVGVRNLDVDGELWVKLRLVPSQPWVGAATWAFVSLPKIKLDLSPFRLFNLMAIPFLSVFLTKLLAEDLPQLFVLPKRISMDFLKGRANGPVPKDFKGAASEGNKDFSGELSVTLVDARKLIYTPYGKSDPYVLLTLGDQVIKSKRNSQTSVFGPPGSPIWNQDFQFLVVDPKTQRLVVRVRDYFGLTAITIGIAEVDLRGLQDTVPVDRVVNLRGRWGPFEKRFVGELLLRLTYTAYVEEDEDEEKDEGTPYSSTNGYLTEAGENDADEVPLFKEVINKAVESAEREKPLANVFAAVIAELSKESIEDDLTTKGGSGNGAASEGEGFVNKAKMGGLVADEAERSETRTGLLLLALVTVLVVLVDISINFSNFLNP
ncbi:hypothetical protein GOP47_0005195 [Adiantum capillus-veneris]|uniref:Uncharacterized protein n=1 Tax=Adiantum capillus-veneris TaxID=13818 RepID=A0A9D4V5J5_ADICA|nr:hypothetical protein GOP47_0005195 [Adiantum capillus-veneris]